MTVPKRSIMVAVQDLHRDLRIFTLSNSKTYLECQKVAVHWFNFSKFIPEFLLSLSENVSNLEVRNRILQIVAEENGEGLALSHHELFRQAMEQCGLKVCESNIPSISKFKNLYSCHSNLEEKEAFAIGVSFGLEIIAEENINFLLEHTSYSADTFRLNEESLFFKIHLVNEKEHIEKCFQNLASVNSKSIDSLKAGVKLSLNFWKNFWEEAISE